MLCLATNLRTWGHVRHPAFGVQCSCDWSLWHLKINTRNRPKLLITGSRSKGSKTNGRWKKSSTFWSRSHRDRDASQTNVLGPHTPSHVNPAWRLEVESSYVKPHPKNIKKIRTTTKLLQSLQSFFSILRSCSCAVLCSLAVWASSLWYPSLMLEISIFVRPILIASSTVIQGANRSKPWHCCALATRKFKLAVKSVQLGHCTLQAIRDCFWALNSICLRSQHAISIHLFDHFSWTSFGYRLKIQVSSFATGWIRPLFHHIGCVSSWANGTTLDVPQRAPNVEAPGDLLGPILQRVQQQLWIYLATSENFDGLKLEFNRNHLEVSNWTQDGASKTAIPKISPEISKLEILGPQTHHDFGPLFQMCVLGHNMSQPADHRLSPWAAPVLDGVAADGRSFDELFRDTYRSEEQKRRNESDRLG